MRKLVTIGLAAVSLAASAGVGAAVAQPYGYGQYYERYDRDRDGARHHHDRYDHRYGRWDDRWGRHPAPPPRHWRHTGSWYGHVRACQLRYRSYHPARDMYFTGRVWVRCRL